MEEEKRRGHDEVIHALLEAAEKEGKLNILSNFQNGFLAGLVQQKRGDASYSDMLEILEDCIHARQELQMLECEMGKSLFIDLVTGGFLERRGVEVETDSPIYWIRYGRLYKNSWRIPAASPKAKAYVRAVIWLLDVATAQTSHEDNTLAVFCMDTNVGMLDFNLDIYRNALNFVSRLFPVTVTSRLYLFGVPKVVPLLYNMACRVLPVHSKDFRLCACYDDALDFVSCESDVPDFWFDDDAPVDRFRFDRTSTWCFERCLSDDNPVTTKDVLNPGPWAFPLDAKCTIPQIRRLSVFG